MHPKTSPALSFLLVLILGSTLAYSQPQDKQPDPPILVWVQPQLGFTGSGPGAGLEINTVFRGVDFGARAQISEELCLFCSAESRSSQSLLLGAFMDLTEGNSFSIRTGITRFSGIERGEKQEEDNAFLSWGDDYDLIPYRGFGVPLELGMIFGGENLGFGITVVLELSKENPSGGLFFGLAMGSLGG